MMKVWMTSLMLMAGAAFAAGGNSAGNGGDAYAIAFVQAGMRALAVLKAKREAERGGIDLVRLNGAISNTRVESVAGAVFLNGTRQVDAINVPSDSRIVLSRTSWDAIAEPQRMVLALHEYLGILLMEDGNYQISSKVLATPASNSDPSNPERNFACIINHYSEGTPKLSPWVGYWWPFSANGIADKRYSSGSMSPLQKYEAAADMGDQATKWEFAHHGKTAPGLQAWWGHDRGWANAAVLFPEPPESVIVHGITFTRSDIKALLSEVAMDADSEVFGNPVNSRTPKDDEAWDDVFPNQMVDVLANYMGKARKGLAMDRYTGDQAWSVVLAGYRFAHPTPRDYLGEDPVQPGVYRIKLKFSIWWYEDNTPGSDETIPFDFQVEGTSYQISRRDLAAEIWLDGPVNFDENGKIISSGDLILKQNGKIVEGGKWRMGEGHSNDAWPDTIWAPRAIAKSTVDSTGHNPYVDIDWIKKYLMN